MKPVLQKGQLVKWSDDRGFGFIQPSEQHQHQIFLHISDINHSIRRPKTGDIIHYQIGSGKDGKPRAYNALIRGATAPISVRPITSKMQPSEQLRLGLEVALLALLPTIGSVHVAFTQKNPILFILYVGMSWRTFSLYAEDKLRAKQGRWRIKEDALHRCELLGG
jgi:cold shock CspA family protein